jgi:exopolysaccharide biosynthesis polyprenyl glycosylphosphotransferase
VSLLSAHPDEPAAKSNEAPETGAFARLIPGEIAAIRSGVRKPPASLGKAGREKLWNIAEISGPQAREDRLAFLLPPPMQSRDAGNWLRSVSADLALVTLNWLLIGALLVPMRMLFPRTRVFGYATGAPLFLVGIALLHGTLITLIGYSGGLYSKTKAGELRDQTRVLANSVLWSSTLLAIVFILQGSPGARAGLFFVAGVLHLAILHGWRRVLLQPRTDLPAKRRNVLIVGGGAAGRRVASCIHTYAQSARNVCGFLDDEMPIGEGVIGRIRDLACLARRWFIDEVILSAQLERGQVQRVVREACRLRLDIGIVPELFGCKPADSAMERIGDLPMICIHTEPLPGATLACKRVFDVLTSALGLLVLSPLFAIIGALIKLDTPGSIFYRADRAGRKGMPFSCFKFRTMVSNADALKGVLRGRNERSGPAFKIADDPRITRVGSWLRRYSLDELPQLWNVLRGDMSLVGPRPHPLDDFAEYEIEHLARLDMTPGITGLWQVTARRDPSFQRAMELDREYIQRWNLGLDFQILLKTILAVLQGGGE